MIHKDSFSLIHLLAIVVILIILAVAAPRFAGASMKTRSSALATDPRGVRSQPELNKPQHNDQLPSATGGTGKRRPERLGRVFKMQVQPSGRNL